MSKFYGRDSGPRFYEIYLLDDKAALPFLLLQYHSDYVGSFMFDDLVADKLHQLNWSIDHLDREMSMLVNKFNTLDFFKENNISDKKLEDAFPTFIKSLEVFSEEIHRRRELLIDEAEEILKAGWK